MKSKTIKLEGLIPSLEEDKKSYDNLDQRAMAHLHKIGLRLPKQPMRNGEPFVPMIPEGPGGPSLGGLDERGLSDLFAQFNAHYQYVAAQYAILEIQKVALKEKFDITEAEVIILLEPPESSKKVRARVDPRIKKLKWDMADVKAKILLVGKILSGVEEELKLVSREVTIRDKERKGVEREDNIGRTRRYSGVPGGRRRR